MTTNDAATSAADLHEIDLTDARVWDTSAIVALDAVVAKFAERGIEAEIVGLNRHAADLHGRSSGKVSHH